MSMDVQIKDLRQFFGKEDTVALVPEPGMPLDVLMCGVTYPHKAYAISRAKTDNFFVVESILSGSGFVWADGAWRRAVKGESYILTDRNSHHYFADPANPWQKVWVNFRCSYMGAMLNAFDVADGVYPIDFKNSLLQLFHMASSAVKYSELCYHAAEMLNNIVIKIAAHTRNDLSEAYNIAEALKACVYRKTSLDDIASQMHLSKSQLIRIFKQAYSVTPYDYLLRQKIDTAKLLIANSSMSFKEIAEKLHISDGHYFSALFLKHTGMRPKDYRTQHMLPPI